MPMSKRRAATASSAIDRIVTNPAHEQEHVRVYVCRTCATALCGSWSQGVRVEAVRSVTIDHDTLPRILAFTRDPFAKVAAAVYNKLADAGIEIQHLSLDQKLAVLLGGLREGRKERREVRTAAANLLVHWFKDNCQSDPLVLLAELVPQLYPGWHGHAVCTAPAVARTTHRPLHGCAHQPGSSHTGYCPPTQQTTHRPDQEALSSTTTPMHGCHPDCARVHTGAVVVCRAGEGVPGRAVGGRRLGHGGVAGRRNGRRVQPGSPRAGRGRSPRRDWRLGGRSVHGRRRGVPLLLCMRAPEGGSQQQGPDGSQGNWRRRDCPGRDCCQQDGRKWGLQAQRSKWMQAEMSVWPLHPTYARLKNRRCTTLSHLVTAARKPIQSAAMCDSNRDSNRVPPSMLQVLDDFLPSAQDLLLLIQVHAVPEQRFVATQLMHTAAACMVSVGWSGC